VRCIRLLVEVLEEDVYRLEAGVHSLAVERDRSVGSVAVQIATKGRRLFARIGGERVGADQVNN
jgi:hypothetical protein